VKDKAMVVLPHAILEITPDGVTVLPVRRGDWVTWRFIQDACAYAMSDSARPVQAAEIVEAACRAARECGLELPGFVPAQASCPAAVPGAAGGEPDPACLPARPAGGPARHRRRPALPNVGRLLHH
jgi:hypothetical protein